VRTNRADYVDRTFWVDCDHNIAGEGPHRVTFLGWWDELEGNGSWMFADSNPAAMIYGIRSGFKGLPLDNEVLYGHLDDFGGLGLLIHISELQEEVGK